MLKLLNAKRKKTSLAQFFKKNKKQANNAFFMSKPAAEENTRAAADNVILDEATISDPSITKLLEYAKVKKRFLTKNSRISFPNI